MAAPPRFLDILQLLVRHEVDFILVGGVAAIVEGAPISTLDLDVVIRPTAKNRDRLLAALSELNARYLDPAGRHIAPDRVKLETLRLHQLLDVLERIGKGHSYEDLLGHTRIYEVSGIPLRTLGLEMIIRSKEEANREKDRAVLPVLRRTLQLQKGPSGEND